VQVQALPRVVPERWVGEKGNKMVRLPIEGIEIQKIGKLGEILFQSSASGRGEGVPKRASRKDSTRGKRGNQRSNAQALSRMGRRGSKKT